MHAASLRTDRPAFGVLRLLLDRPESRNALDVALVAALIEQFERLASVSADAPGRVRAVILGSADPRVFCSGADLDMTDDERAAVSDQLYALYGLMVSSPVPVVAVVDGPAVGGGAQLAVAADVRIAGPGARFRFLGPGHGLAVGAWALSSLVGRGKAMDLCLSGHWLEVQESQRIGLVEKVTDQAMLSAIQLAAVIAGSDSGAVARVKALVNDRVLLTRLAEEREGNRTSWSGNVAGLRAGGPREAGSDHAG